MADLIGTARIRVDMPTARATRQTRPFAARTQPQLRGVPRRIRVDMPTAGATRQIRQFAARTEAQLRGVQRRITATTRDLRAMRGTSIDITLNDRTARGIAATRASVRSLQRLSPVTITTRLD